MSRTTTKNNVSSSICTFTSVAAQLLLRGRGGREAADGDDSIEFFSDLRKSQREPRLSGQTERGGLGRPEQDGRGTTRWRGGSDELLSSEIGKHDYDWLLTPPATPLRPPATSSSGRQVSTVVANQLARAGSVSYTKSKSRRSQLMQLGKTTDRENENATSRLARSSSATQSSSLSTPANASSGGYLSHVRTLSSASVSSSHTARSNASVSSTRLVSTASSPRTPVAARSAWSTARPCRLDKASGKQSSGPVVARQPRASTSLTKSSTGRPAPTCSRSQREHATPSGVLSPRSTTSTSPQAPPTPSKRANAVARSRLAGQRGGAGSTAQAPSSPTTSQNRDVHLTRGARALPSSSSDGVKTRALPAASTTTQQRWRQSLAPAIAVARIARRDDSVGNESPGNKAAAAMISAKKAKATTQRTTAATVGSGLARTASRLKSANSNAPTKAGQPHDVNHGGGAPARWKSALQARSGRSVSSISRLGCTYATSEVSAGSISMGQSTPENGRRVAVRAVAAARIVLAGPDAFPSTRYDAMLLREDPKNLTWLRGCGEGDEGLQRVHGSLEPFDVATGLS